MRDFHRELAISVIKGNNLKTLQWIFSGESKLVRRGISSDNSLLQKALEVGSMDAARELIRLGMPDRYGKPDAKKIIGIAVSKGVHDIVDSLLKKCNWLSSRSDLLRQVITNSKSYSNHDMLDVLLNYLSTEEIGSAGEDGESALNYAIRFQNFNTIRKLLDRGAMITHKGEPPLITAVKTDSVRLVKFLLKLGLDPNTSWLDRESVLRCAIGWYVLKKYW